MSAAGTGKASASRQTHTHTSHTHTERRRRKHQPGRSVLQHAAHERPQVCSTQDEGLQEFGGLPNTDFYFLPSVCSFHLFLECKLCKRKKEIAAHCCCFFSFSLCAIKARFTTFMSTSARGNLFFPSPLVCV